ncbi:MAG: peptidoglycan bridge formation protein FemAB [bacterium]|nr:peptidoglycan bridge formation glycyltransferase FemA/FemB family protein [Candidatus Microgenomates bacterium CPR3]MCQ3944198.1 peptidoglycan bridge formation protein FemAB [bacterium]RIK51977.1 MAG: peptidoglycan bridge formation protein FemAB [Candidatus Microgenomates bacterium]
MNEKLAWNKQVDHPLQAWEWGEFREATGIAVVRAKGMQITIHPIPHTPWTVGYYPKGSEVSREQVEAIKKVARENNCIFIKCEPKIESKAPSEKLKKELLRLGFVPGRPLFTKYNFVLDVSKSEEELLSSFKQKTRYNIKVAQKRGVTVELSDMTADFERYLALTKETTERQGFYAHSSSYHRKMWETLGRQASDSAGQLSAHLLVARYEGQVITTWILFRFKETLYYPYGASTREHREVMANNLVMWEAIKLAKKWGCNTLDMWGALGPEPDKNDPWYGFHTFKSGYGARHVEYIGTWDYVAKPMLYHLYTVMDNLRWLWLRTKKLVTKKK